MNLEQISNWINIENIDQKVSKEVRSWLIEEGPITQRIKLTELLTADLIQKVLQKISDWKKSLDDILYVTSTDLKYNKSINIDNLLFLM